MEIQSQPPEVVATPVKRRALSRNDLAQILLKDDRPVEYVDCPEWGGTIKLRAMTGDEAVAFAKFSKDSKNDTEMFRIIAASAVDDNNDPLFPDPEILRSRSLSVLNRLQDAALRLNGYKADAKEQAKKV